MDDQNRVHSHREGGRSLRFRSVVVRVVGERKRVPHTECGGLIMLLVQLHGRLGQTERRDHEEESRHDPGKIHDQILEQVRHLDHL